jgi:hypothetical protein
MRGEGHAAEFGGQRAQDRVLDPFADLDEGAFPPAADGGSENRQEPGQGDHAEAVPLHPAADRAGNSGHHGAQGEGTARGQRGHPAVAPRAGQQRAHRQQAGQVKSRTYQNPRNSNNGVQSESDHDPNRRLSHGPRRAPQ